MTDSTTPVPSPELMPPEKYGVNQYLSWLLGLAILGLVLGGVLVLVGTSQNNSSYDGTGGLALLALGGTLTNGGGLSLVLWLAASGLVRGLSKNGARE